MNEFSRLLLKYRQKRKMTQKELAEKLSYSHPQLRGTNTVTLSRWETGTTEPGATKKSLVIRFFAQEGCLEDAECLEILDQKYRVEILEILTQVFQKRYQYIIGNFPDFGTEAYRVLPLCEVEDPSNSIDLLLDIERVSNVPGYYRVDHEKIESWCRHPATLALVVQRKGQQLGHYLMIKIHDEVAEEIAYRRRGQYEVGPEDLCSPETPGTYYIHALYGSNPRIAAILNVEAYRHFLRHYDRIHNILIFSSRKDGAEITKDYGIRRVASGVDSEYGIQWYGMLSPIGEVLFSEKLIRGIF